MKIDTDLRLAIRSAEKAQPIFGYSEERNAEREAVRALCKAKPSIASQVRRAARQKAASERSRQQADEIFQKLGLYSDGERIGNYEKFKAVGGKLPKTNKRRWKFDQVMAELAAAEAKQSTAILKRYGINWV